MDLTVGKRLYTSTPPNLQNGVHCTISYNIDFLLKENYVCIAQLLQDGFLPRMEKSEK